MLLNGCATQKRYPSKRSRDYATVINIKKCDAGFLVTARKYSSWYLVVFECLPDSIKIGKEMDVTNWTKK